MATTMTTEQAQRIADEHNACRSRGDYLIIDPATWTAGDYMASNHDVDHFRREGLYCLRVEDVTMETWDVIDWAERVIDWAERERDAAAIELHEDEDE